MLGSGDAIEDFVTRLYRLVLSRTPDAGGFAYWTNQLRNEEISASRLAYGFFFSNEMNNRNVSNGEFIDILYRTILDREPDPAGRIYWLNRMNGGLPRVDVFAGFVDSIEFGTLADAAGIYRGTFAPSPISRMQPFIARLYRLALEREPDAGGMAYWTNRLVQGRTGGQVAYGFIFSAEMNNRNLSNGDFVDILYRTFLDREPDAGGRAYWIARLQAGESRVTVFAGFANSVEFGVLSANAGIVQGTFIP